MSKVITEVQARVLRELRSQGYAVIVWAPEELKYANRRHVEDRSVELGFEIIEELNSE